MTSYQNPSTHLGSRPFYSLTSLDFKMMIQKLHEEFSVDIVQKQYCSDCHWTFARAGQKFHSTCKKVSASIILGK